MIAALFFTLAPQSVPAPLDPARYTSRSGAWQLEVDPHDRWGEGAADYRALHHGVLAWEGCHPFALTDVVVTDDGRALGCACVGNPFRDGARVLAALLDADGTAHRLAAAARRAFRGPDQGPSPWVQSAHLAEDTHEFVVELGGMRDDSTDRVWSFDVVTGSRLGAPPKAEFAAPSPGTPPAPRPLHRSRSRGVTLRIDWSACPAVRLQELGRTHFDPPIDEVESRFALGPDGSLAVLPRGQDRLTLHAADGRWLWTRELRMRFRGVFAQLAWHPDGTLDVLDHGRVRFDARGVELDRCESPRPFAEPMWSFASTASALAGWRFEVNLERADLVTPSGASAVAFGRRADRLWLGEISQAELTPDGGLVVHERRDPVRGGPPLTLHVLSPLGELEQSWEFESRRGGVGRAHVAGPLLVARAGPDRIVIVDRERGSVLCVEIDEPLWDERVLDVLPTPDGRELCVLQRGATEVRRLRLADALQ
ncbi:MAG: hypothetical protein IPJ77_01935 [Planctomycetes bacterium]|nr:hypothetical protein [Planctomycetota bacterium]